jgi:hypothetical protein
VIERIEITPEGDHSYTVRVRSGREQTTHQVMVPVQLLLDLGWMADDEAGLVRASFEFLLEREPASSILRRFDLDVIGRYFPEYGEAMRR